LSKKQNNKAIKASFICASISQWRWKTKAFLTNKFTRIGLYQPSMKTDHLFQLYSILPCIALATLLGLSYPPPTLRLEVGVLPKARVG